MHGDPVADAYAALIPQHGFQRLASMLKEACGRGLERVLSAPQELVRFIEDMERFPVRLDAKLIEQGARIERNAYASAADPRSCLPASRKRPYRRPRRPLVVRMSPADAGTIIPPGPTQLALAT